MARIFVLCFVFGEFWPRVAVMCCLISVPVEVHLAVLTVTGKSSTCSNIPAALHHKLINIKYQQDSSIYQLRRACHLQLLEYPTLLVSLLPTSFRFRVVPFVKLVAIPTRTRVNQECCLWRCRRSAAVHLSSPPRWVQSPFPLWYGSDNVTSDFNEHAVDL